jgi:DNA-binding transcriptional LysR family regulator
MWADLLARLGLKVSQANFAVITKFQQLQWELAKQGTAMAIFPGQIGDAEPGFVRAFESRGPIMEIPLWLVCHRELHTSLRVRRVFDILVEMIAN